METSLGSDPNTDAGMDQNSDINLKRMGGRTPENQRSGREEEALGGPRSVPSQEGRRPFLVHLEELRRRLLRSLLWVGLGSAFSFRFSNRILTWLIEPVGEVIFLNPAEPFLVRLTLSLVSGGILASPFLAWEVWGYVTPALRPRERRFGVLFIPASAGLFFLGAWFGWRALLPVAIRFLLGFGSDQLTPMIAVGSYVGFAGWLIGACGLIFQMPVAAVLLAHLQLIRPLTLIRQWRVALVVILVASAMLTPTPDVVTQILLSIPMALLYLVSVGLAIVVRKDGALRTT